MSWTLIGVDLEDDGFYQAVAPKGAIEFDNNASGQFAAPIVLVGDWVATSGDKPRVATGTVVAGAEGSSIVVQRIPASGSTPSRTRVVMVSGTGGWAKLKNDMSTTVDLSVDEYVDCWEAATPYFGPVSPFNKDTTAGSIGLFDDVTDAKRSWRIP